MVLFVMKSDPKILQAFRWAVGDIDKTQAEIGDILGGLKQSAVSLLLGDNREVKQGHINALAEYMKITPEELMERAGRWAKATGTTAQPPNDFNTMRRRAIEFENRAAADEIMAALAEIERLNPAELEWYRQNIVDRCKFLRKELSPKPGPQEKSSAS